MNAQVDDLIKFESWLVSQPSRTVELMACRIALRMVPFWEDFRTQREIPNIAPTVSFPLWWNLFANWVFFRVNSDNPKILENKAAAQKNYSEGQTTPFAKFFLERSQEKKGASLSAFLFSTINAATQLAGSDEPAERLWEEISSDILAIEGGRTLRFVSSQPLWARSQIPSWVLAAWDKQKVNFLNENQSWDVWTDWYENVLNAGPVDEDLEVKKAVMNPKFWASGSPKGVNEALAATIQKHKEELTRIIHDTEMVVV